MEEEFFLTIDGFDGAYAVSNLGRVWNTKMNRELVGSICGNGYKRVTLTTPDKKKVYKNVHRLVAETFLDHDDEHNIVNHIDENKLNNNVENLEWVDMTYNNTYGSRKPQEIEQYTLDGELINTYYCLREAANSVGVNSQAIYQACAGITHTCAHYKWRYKSA